MGLLVPQATLPSGITVSNVYICVATNGLSVWRDTMSNTYNYNGAYKIYAGPDKLFQPLDNLQLHFKSNTIAEESIYTTFYNQLMVTYPDSIEA